MSNWYWVLLVAVAGVSFLFGRYRGIEDTCTEFERQKGPPVCRHGVDTRAMYPCGDCELELHHLKSLQAKRLGEGKLPDPNLPMP